MASIFEDYLRIGIIRPSPSEKRKIKKIRNKAIRKQYRIAQLNLERALNYQVQLDILDEKEYEFKCEPYKITQTLIKTKFQYDETLKNFIKHELLNSRTVQEQIDEFNKIFLSTLPKEKATELAAINEELDHLTFDYLNDPWRHELKARRHIIYLENLKTI